MRSTEAPLGLLVEGKSEYYAIPVLLRTLNVRHAAPANFQGQGADPRAVVHRMFPCLRAVLAKNLSKILVILDREDRVDCAPDFAGDVQTAITAKLEAARVAPECAISVVCADRKIENWLLADPKGLAQHAHIQDKAASRRKTNVDGTDGEKELRALFSSRQHYIKGQMTGHLASTIDPGNEAVQRRSRSLRKFVKEATG